MNAISLIFSDIDGTLLDRNRDLAPKTISEIKRITNSHKIPFILASARMPKAMRHLQGTLGISEAIICFNGALVIDKNGAILSDHTIPFDPLHYVVKKVYEADLHLSLYIGDEWFVNKNDYWAKREENNTRTTFILAELRKKVEVLDKIKQGPHKILVMGDKEKLDGLQDLLLQNFNTDIAIYRSKETYIEINSFVASKKNAVETIAKYYNIPKHEILAFGDNYNDVEMLDWVGTGVAVANARPEVLKIANEITLSNIDDGVAVFLEKRFPHI